MREALVSCLMATFNRRPFIERAIDCFLAQDYRQRELVILDDGSDPIEDLIPADPRFHYIRLTGRRWSLGAKHNLGAEHARGRILALWDDDDWYADHRLSAQVLPLLEGRAHITGIDPLCVLDLASWRSWTHPQEIWNQRARCTLSFASGTMVFWRQVWDELTHFPDTTSGPDWQFLAAAYERGAIVERIADPTCFIYIRHGANSWTGLERWLDGDDWQEVEPKDILPEKVLWSYQE